MKLILGFSSPFVRKVRIAAAIKNLSPYIELVTKESDYETYLQIRRKNPLNKIPTLILNNGEALYDSHVICEYLDSLAQNTRLFPYESDERFRVLRLASLADGLIEATLSIVMERRQRPETLQLESLIERQQLKIEATLSFLEGDTPHLSSPNYGDITLACALGYLDLRQEGLWRKRSPLLLRWLEEFSERVPAYAETDPGNVN
jgi:glutathione S-transferase